MKLNSRQRQVLGATVRHYIATARPVGSEALLDDFNPRVSAATIRNAMGFLEKSGLLYQPHISAGRIPSDSGYRIYVDQIVTPSEAIAKQIDQQFSEQLNWQEQSLDAILRGASQILSTLSGYITLITVPQDNTVQLRHLQLVQIDPERLMLVVVFDSYETQSVLVNLPVVEGAAVMDAERLDRELQLLSNFLNEALKGRSLPEITVLDWSEIGQEFEHYGEVLHASLMDLHQRRQQSFSTQILINGVAEVLRRQPEFSEIQHVQTLIDLLESQQAQLSALIFEPEDLLLEPGDGLTGRRVTVRIGAENPLTPIQTCTLVSATYQRGNVPVGSVGMLGPTRMMYENAIALVEATADYLSEVLSQ